MQSETNGSVTAQPLAAHLRDATRDAHTKAEQHAVQRAMVQGHATAEHVAMHLAQSAIMHKSLEAALADSGDPRVKALYSLALPRAGMAEQGARALCPSTSFDTPEAAAIASQVARDRADPASLLGYFYVTEGSTNGNRYILHAIMGSLRLREPLAFFDPYGESQRARWGEFRGVLNATVVSDAERERATLAAGRMFDWASDLADEVARTLPLSPRLPITGPGPR